AATDPGAEGSRAAGPLGPVYLIPPPTGPTSMPIEFKCKCGKLLSAREEHAGRVTRCPACGNDLTIPGDRATPSAPGKADREPSADEPGRPRPDADGGRAAGERPVSGAPARTSGMAVASLVLGLGSSCLWLFGGLPAILLGVISLVQIGRSKGA